VSTSGLRASALLTLAPEQFAPACDIFSGQIYAAIPDYEALASIAQNDYICLYELEGEYTPPTAEVMRDHGGEDGKPPVEEYATLPVFSVLGKDYGRKDTIGVPFFISVPRAHVSDEAYIRDVLISKFMRHATSEGAEILEEYRTSSSAAAAGQQQEQAAPPAGDWEMVDADAAPHATPPQADPSVADLPSSEESTPPVPGSFDASGSANQAPSRDANGFDGAQAIAEDANAVSAFQPLENASQPRRQKALFTVSFTARRERDSTFPRSGDNVGEPLAERSARRQAALSSAAGTASPPQDADETIMADAAGAEPWPLVYTGGALVCTWSHNASTAVFGSDIPTKHPWGASEKVVDPDLVREREDAANRGAGYRAPQLSIDDCLDEFTKEEKLGADDPWYCPTCKEFRQATKKFDLWKAPDILVVHLKRFSGGRMQSRDKIEDLIDFPIEGLDLTRRVEGAKAVANLQARGEEVPSVFNLADSVGSVASDLNDDAVAADAPIYDLYAVDNHFGGLGGGHYTAFAKNAEDGLWHNYDDSSVSLVAEPERVKTKAAYLLFYRRRTTRPIGGKSREKTDVAVSRGSTATLNEASSDEAYTPFSSGTDATMRDVRGATPAPFATMPSSLYVSSGPNDGLYPDDEYDLYGPAQPPTPAAYDSDAPGDASRVPWAASTFAPRRNSQASTASAEAAYDSSPGSPNIDSSRRSSFDSRPHGPGPSLDDEEFEVESD
jgi:ubiquitin carboxyl-terminal hydrolase 4/11/15